MSALGGAMRLPPCAVVALAFALGLVGCGSPHSRFESHIARGKQYLATGNLDKASIEFRNALQIEPRNGVAFYLNGKVAERRGGYREAIDYYQSAVDVRPDDTLARASLARVFVFGGGSQRALEILSPGLLDHPDDPDLLAARAAARHELKDERDARDDAERAVQLAPANEDAIAVLSALSVRAGDTEKAISLVTGAVTKAPDSVDLRRILASVYLSAAQPRKAEEQMRKIISLEPNEMSARMDLARHFTQRHELDAAQDVLEQAVRDLPHKDVAKLTLVDFVTTQRSQSQGERILRDFVTREPDNQDLRLALGMLIQRSGAVQQAVAIYRQVIERDGLGPKGLAARDRIAAAEISQGHDAAAGKLLAEVLEESPRDDDALIMRANLSLAHGDPTNAIVDLRAVLHDQPKSVVLQRTLARAYVAKGQPALAEEALRSVLNSGVDDEGVRIDLAQVLLQTERPAQAVALLEEATRKAPQDPQVRAALIRAYMADRDLARARIAAEDLKRLRPDAPEGYQLAGLIAHDDKRPDDAERELERAFELQPSSLDILASLTRFGLERGRSAVVIARLQRALSRDPKNIQIVDLLGATYLGVKDLPRAAETFSHAIAIGPQSWAPYRGLAQVKLASGDAKGALEQYQIAFRLAPSQPLVVTELASLYEKQGQIDAAITCYDTLLHGAPGSRRIAANNLAMLLVTYKTDATSLDRARGLIAGFDMSTDASLLDTAGWVHFRRREYREAVNLLERAADHSPDSKVIRDHLGKARSAVAGLSAPRRG